MRGQRWSTTARRQAPGHPGRNPLASPSWVTAPTGRWLPQHKKDERDKSDKLMPIKSVPHPAEEAALLAQLGDVLAAGLREVAQHALLVGGQLGRRLHVEMHEQVAPALAAQMRHALAADAQRGR